MDSLLHTYTRRIHLFGALSIQEGQAAIRLSRGRAHSLFAYLVLHPQSRHRREAIANLLFPDAPPDRARRNLSDTLHRLRKTLGENWLWVEADTLAIQKNQRVWVDVWEFDKLVNSDQPDELQRAVALYTGDLLPEIYDNWVLVERELRRNQLVAVLEKLVAHYEARANLQQALLHARRLVLTEPLHEPAHQSYLRLLGRLKRYGEALAHYEDLRQHLRAELNAEPLPETRRMIEAFQQERHFVVADDIAQDQGIFVGRTRERATALAAVESIFKQQGGILTIEGEAGLGKSRLAHEIIASARWRGVLVLQGVVSEVPEASPFSPLMAALAPVFNSSRIAQLETLLPTETLASLSRLNPAWHDRSAPTPSPASSPTSAIDQAGRQFYNALRALGATLARLTPLMLVLDDVQWASPALWDSLQAFAQGLAQQGGLLLLIYRRPEIEHTHGWEVLQTWDRAGQLQTISLEPLSLNEVAQWLSKAISIPSNEVHAITGGNPFLINEWLAEPLSGQKPAYRHRTTTAQRLAALAPEAHHALVCAAVLGENIPFRLWVRVTDLEPLTLAGISETLVAHRWLKASAMGHEFAHDLVRQAVYAAMTPAQRRKLHGRAGREVQVHEPDNARSRAFHFDRAGLSEDAAHAYQQAGEQALARFAFRDAQAALQRALVLMPATPTPERIQTALTLAQACETTGDRAAQAPALNEVLNGARQMNTPALLLQALLVSGYAADQIGQFDTAQSQLTEALALARQLQDPAQETYAVFLLGDFCIQRGQWPAAQTRFAETLALAQTHANVQLEGRALRGLGIAARQMGAPQDSVKWFEHAIAVHRSAGDRWSDLVTKANLLSTYYDLGAWDQLLAMASDVWHAADVLGDYSRGAVVKHLQGLAAYALGDYAQARQLLSQSEAAYAAGGQRRMAGLLRNTLGLVAEDEGNDEAALALYRSALANAETLQAATEAAYAQHDLGALLLHIEQPVEAIPLLEASRAAWIAQQNTLLQVKSEAFLGLALLTVGEHKRAAELAEQNWAIFQTGVPIGEQPQGWLWAFYRLLMGLGDDNGRARDVLSAAYTELQRQARAIGDSERRRSFFERVPLNRAIVAAHDHAHDQFKAVSRVITVSLARRGVPLGRTLKPDEFVWVRWTMHAADDEAIADKASRRQHRLKRLLREAELQGAAPTDDDLAHALEVSRRTILRDMQILATAPSSHTPTPSTRKRKV